MSCQQFIIYVFSAVFQNHLRILKIKANQIYLDYLKLKLKIANQTYLKFRYVKNNSNGRNSYKNCDGEFKCLC